MIGFGGAYAGLRHSSYIFGWPLWANWLFFFVWAWAILLMVRWSWQFSYIRLRGKGIIPDLGASFVAASTLFLTHPWISHVDSQKFMIAFAGWLLVYSIASQYYYKKIVLGIQDWDRRQK